MKLRSMAMVVFGVGALVAGGAGCKKKPKEGKAPDTGSAVASGTGAGTGAGTAAEPPKEAKLEGKALADKYIECTNHIAGAKWDDFKSKCLATGYQGHAADMPDAMNLDGVMEYFKTQSTAFPDLKIQPQVVLVSGRNILGVGLMTGTNSGPMKTPAGEVPTTNKKIGQLMFHRLTIDDENRAAEEWAYFDPATMVGQLGMLPKEAGPSRPMIEKGMEGAPIVVVAADDDKEKANIDVVKKAHAAFVAKKMPDFLALHADDAVESDQAGPKDYTGKKEIQASAEMFLKAFPDFANVGEPTLFAAGDYVVLIGKFEGTNKGPLGPIKATNKKVTGEFAELIQMKDGKIAKLWRFRNGMAMARQMGLMPEPKAPAGGGSAAAPAGGGSGSAAAPAGGSAGSAAAPKGDAPKKDEPKKDEPKKAG